jgi:dTDP-4-dehydrorhamnose 3,5-epimerase
MTIQKLNIDGCYVIEHKTFPDDRGMFREWFKASDLQNLGISFNVEQANYSHSKVGVLRGIHYSVAPEGQAKLVTCGQGEIVDVLVDLRKGSPTYLNVEYVNLEANSGKTIFIASGVGHGFVVQSESASVVYLTSSGYAPDFEKSISPLDPALGIKWSVSIGSELLLSPADRSAPTLQEAESLGSLPVY